MTVARPRLQPTDVVGSYEIISPIGEGGMGQVFLARHRTIRGRKAAIKVAHGRDRSVKATTSFYNEIDTLSRIHHPNVVALLDAGEDGEGTFWMALEYVEGRTLSELIREEGRLLIEDSLLLGGEIAEGVAAAHAIGVFHRDIKPANIIVTPDLQIKVVDFGIAKLTRELPDANATQIGMVKGTVAFLPPEALIRVPGVKADHRQDIFALGVLMYVMLTGRHPFADDDGSLPMETILSQRILMIKEPWLPDVLFGFPEDLARVISKMMMKAPRDRHESMAEVAGLLVRARATFAPGLQAATPALRSIASRRAALLTQSSPSDSADRAAAPPGASVRVGQSTDKRRAEQARRGGTVGARPAKAQEMADLSGLMQSESLQSEPSRPERSQSESLLPESAEREGAVTLIDPKQTLLLETLFDGGPHALKGVFESDELREASDEAFAVDDEAAAKKPASKPTLPPAAGTTRASRDQAEAALLRSLERRGRSGQSRGISHELGGPRDRATPEGSNDGWQKHRLIAIAALSLLLAFGLGLLILLRR